MYEQTVRGPDGTILAFVDPRAVEEPAPATTEEVPVEEARERPTSRAITPDQRKSMKELLGKAVEGAPHVNPIFTTGLAVGGVALIVVFALIALSRTPANAPVAMPTSVPATAQQATAPAVAIAAPTVGRAMVAYAAPDGAALGAISPDRAITLTGTFGGDWVQITTSDSGAVWVHKTDLPGDLMSPSALAALPDLAPPTATVRPTVVPAPPAPANAPVARPFVPQSSANAPADAAGAFANVCTPDRVVAIVDKGAMQVASCLSLQDAQSSLPGSTVVAANAAEAQQFYARVSEQSTAFAQP